MKEKPKEKNLDKGVESGKISLKDLERSDRDELYYFRYLGDDGEAGFGAIEVHVDGEHPEKTVQGKTRMYRVDEGTGVFTIDGKTYDAETGDMFIIRRGSTYSYKGKMQLFEINIP